jgi:hypothetical protein
MTKLSFNWESDLDAPLAELANSSCRQARTLCDLLK